MTRVYSAYMTAASMEAVKGTETQRTLDDVMRISDSIDRAHNDKPISVFTASHGDNGWRSNEP